MRDRRRRFFALVALGFLAILLVASRSATDSQATPKSIAEQLRLAFISAGDRIASPRLVSVTAKYRSDATSPRQIETDFLFLDGVVYTEREEAVPLLVVVDSETGEAHNRVDVLDTVLRDGLGKTEDLRGYVTNSALSLADLQAGPEEALRLILPDLMSIPRFIAENPTLRLSLEADRDHWSLEVVCRSCSQVLEIRIRRDRSVWIKAGCAHVPVRGAACSDSYP